jgi:hypothetical protein
MGLLKLSIENGYKNTDIPRLYIGDHEFSEITGRA